MKTNVNKRPVPGRGILLLVTGLLSFCQTPGHASSEPLPFSVGERIEYSVSWEMIPAGSAVFKVLEHGMMDGKQIRRFVLEARSKKFIDLFYKIRDRLESHTDHEFSRSVFYSKIQSGKEGKKVRVRFDWEKKQAVYSNFGGKRDPIDIPDHTFDPLSSFYKLRTLDLSDWEDPEKDPPGQPGLFFPVTDGKKCFIQKGAVLKKETISTPSGARYETYLIAPQVTHFSGVFKKSTDAAARVWVSADHLQIPVKIKIKVAVGSIIFDLVSVTSPG